tara:strand:+ start:3474 stop:5576 length:2103 start_codon:yes stop_codon:yes gene_type:complete
MKKTIIVRAPVLSMSGYGEQSRFAIRALKKYEAFLDIYIVPISWGQTGWVHEDNEERKWLDSRIFKTVEYMQNGGKFDYSLQITIPNEWTNMADFNIGHTAGIETNKVEPQWIEKANFMDKVIVVSEHSKQVYTKTKYQGYSKETNQPMELSCTTPIDVVNFCISDIDPIDIDLDLEYDFNYLVVAQNGPRKNLINTIKWFIEENHDREVGLVLKVFTKSGTISDREYTYNSISQLLNSPEYKDRLCKVYLLHGDMKTGEMRSLYTHPKIKALISITHGEGYGLPMFEAAQNGLPIITSGWSGHCDFLYIPTKKKKKGKTKTIGVPHFSEVEFDLAPIPKEAAWEGVVSKDSMWCYPQAGSFKMRLRQVLKNYEKNLERAKKLQTWVNKNFKPEDQYEKFMKATEIEIISYEDVEYIWVSDFFAEQITGGAEMSLQALMDKCPDEFARFNSNSLTESIIDQFKDKKWIFGNIAHLEPSIRDMILEKNIDYTFIEFDYKFCEYRNPLLYENLEDEKCDYASTDLGQAMAKFVNGSTQTFFMSQKQKDIYLNSLSDLDENKLYVLSSIFEDEFFSKIDQLREQQDDASRDKWIVLGSRSWVKGSAESEQYCKNNNMDYEVVFDLTHEELLSKMSTAKGICFKPTGLDTCPRFVIEAKLLGCELELNENVQHLEEDWFKSEDVEKTVAYLKQRPSEFWSRVGA